MFLDEPLLAAAREGKLSEVKRLLAQGADVNTEGDEDRGTALIGASAEGHADVVQYLIVHQANVNQKADYGFNRGGVQSPLQAAAKHPDVAALLRHAGAKK